ncbi:MAG TPA: prolyl-tRNA synthetase associated domain-containing protein [Rhizomicrobium sp.]|jgi:Ala-tRNA(Pro) deacylase|nr:prolyl-tRNA synthetase associated domain-containing protein [Rhizomicrobium sp.]
MGETARPKTVTENELPSPAAREEALYRRFDALGIAWKTHEHAPVFTVEEAAALYAHQPGGHTKNLFLKDKKSAFWLVVARDTLRIDLNALAKQLAAPRFSFGSAELLMEMLGVPPGSVTPFSVINDEEKKVRVVLDEDMLKLEPLNFHPLRNDRTTAISAKDLLSFLRATGHEPVIARLPEIAA